VSKITSHYNGFTAEEMPLSIPEGLRVVLTAVSAPVDSTLGLSLVNDYTEPERKVFKRPVDMKLRQLVPGTYRQSR